MDRRIEVPVLTDGKEIADRVWLRRTNMRITRLNFEFPAPRSTHDSSKG